MTKFVKMSLAAAVAVAGLTSTATAGSLDNTSFSGKLYTEHHASTASSSAPTVTGWEIDFTLTGKTKISDTLTMVTSFEADGDNNDQTKTADAAVGLEDAYFAYANKGAAVKFGRQGISTPNTDGEDGEGAMATYTAGSITAAAAYFPSNSISTGNDITAAALLGSAGPVNFEAWQVNIAGKGAVGSSNTTLVVGGAVSGVSVELRNASTSYNDANGQKDGNAIKAVVSGKVSNVSLTGIYYTTDKDGGATITDPSSANAAELVYLTTHDKANARGVADLDLVAGVVSAPVADKTTAIVKYGMADIGPNTEASELVLQVNYKLAKSTTASVRYADYSTETGATATSAASTTDKTHTRLDITYKF